MITSRGFVQGLAALLIASAPASAELAPTPRIDRALSQSLREGGATQRVIISVKPGHRAEIRQAIEKHGDRVRSEHPFIDALAADIHSDDVNELANHPWVLAVSNDATVYAGGVAGVAASAEVAPAMVPRGALTPSGSGVGVAIIDSGIAPLDDFAGRITGFYDFTRGGIPVAPFDDYGHGTHVAGLIGSSGLLSNNIVWGSSREEGDNIVWGNRCDGGGNIVWGARLVKGGSF